MALHNQLPVYKASYDFIIHIFEQVKHFNRDFKYTIGEKLQNETVDLITCIYRANGSFNKSAILEKALTHTEVLKLLLRLSKDLKLINIPHFADLSEKLENISKQLSGWHKQQLKTEQTASIAKG